jgi:hypothetical protein
MVPSRQIRVDTSLLKIGQRNLMRLLPGRQKAASVRALNLLAILLLAAQPAIALAPFPRGVTSVSDPQMASVLASVREPALAAARQAGAAHLAALLRCKASRTLLFSTPACLKHHSMKPSKTQPVKHLYPSIAVILSPLPRGWRSNISLRRSCFTVLPLSRCRPVR